MEEIEYIRSNKGGQKIIHRGYMYTVHKNKKCGGIRWRCAQRSLNCKGSISTTSLGVPYLNIPHNHMPDAQSIAIARNKIFDHGALDFHNFLDLLINDEQYSSGSPADSMPLEQRLKSPATATTATVLTPPPETPVPEQLLQSQPLSPTKLKVTRQVKPSAPSPIPPPPPPPPLEEVCLKWNSHHSNMQHTFPNLLLREQYVDATLVADGQTLKCHRVILSSCSPYFEDVLASISPYQHPVLFMKDVPFWILKCLCDFMYSGEVHVLQNKLEELLAVAETLKIKGLAGQRDTKMIDTKPEFIIPIKEEKIDEKEKDKEMKKKEDRDIKRKDEKEVKKKEEKEIKKKEEKDVKKKEEKEFKKKEEKEIKKKEEIKIPETKPPKKKEEKELAKKEEKQIKKKEETKEIKEKKRVPVIPSPERPVVKSSKVPKVVIQTPVPILKNKPKSLVEPPRRRERRFEKEKLPVIEKIPITKDTPTTSTFSNPFGLLKPVYEEVTKDPKPSRLPVIKDPKNVNIKRTLQKRLKKRKLTDEREESPPPALSRKGTRSRPRSKVAKYFHPAPVPSYDQSTIVREPHTDQADSFVQVQDIKSEPLYDDSIEIEDNLVGFSETSVSVEEKLIGSYVDNFGRRITRRSKPLIMDVKGITNKADEQHTLKIVNVAELKANKDPLEDPLGLNQSSSDNTSMVEQTDNSLGFRISEVVTEKDDSQSSDVCRELGFKITSVVSEQEEDRKLEQLTTTKIEAPYEEEQEFNEFDETTSQNEDQKPLLTMIETEDSNSNPMGKQMIQLLLEGNQETNSITQTEDNGNKNKMETNEEDELINCPANLSLKIKEELITENEQEINQEEEESILNAFEDHIPEEHTMTQQETLVHESVKLEINQIFESNSIETSTFASPQTTIQNGANAEKVQHENELPPTTISIIREAHLSDEIDTGTDKNDVETANLQIQSTSSNINQVTNTDELCNTQSENEKPIQSIGSDSSLLQSLNVQKDHTLDDSKIDHEMDEVSHFEDNSKVSLPDVINNQQVDEKNNVEDYQMEASFVPESGNTPIDDQNNPEEMDHEMSEGIDDLRGTLPPKPNFDEVQPMDQDYVEENDFHRNESENISTTDCPQVTEPDDVHFNEESKTLDIHQVQPPLKDRVDIAQEESHVPVNQNNSLQSTENPEEHSIEQDYSLENYDSEPNLATPVEDKVMDIYQGTDNITPEAGITNENTSQIEDNAPTIDMNNKNIPDISNIENEVRLDIGSNIQSSDEYQPIYNEKSSATSPQREVLMSNSQPPDEYQPVDNEKSSSNIPQSDVVMSNIQPSDELQPAYNEESSSNIPQSEVLLSNIQPSDEYQPAYNEESSSNIPQSEVLLSNIQPSDEYQPAYNEESSSNIPQSEVLLSNIQPSDEYQPAYNEETSSNIPQSEVLMSNIQPSDEYQPAYNEESSSNIPQSEVLLSNIQPSDVYQPAYNEENSSNIPQSEVLMSNIQPPDDYRPIYNEEGSSNIPQSEVVMSNIQPSDEYQHICNEESSSNIPQSEVVLSNVQSSDEYQPIYNEESSSNIPQSEVIMSNIQPSDEYQSISNEESSSNIQQREVLMSCDEDQIINNSFEKSNYNVSSHDENQPICIEGSSSNITKTAIPPSNGIQPLNDSFDESSSISSQAGACDENQSINNSHDEVSSNILQTDDNQYVDNNADRINFNDPQMTASLCDERQLIDNNYVESSSNVPQVSGLSYTENDLVDESSSTDNVPQVAYNENELVQESSLIQPIINNEEQIPSSENQLMDNDQDSESNTQLQLFNNENELGNKIVEEHSMQSQHNLTESQPMETDHNELMSLQQQSDENYYEDSNSQVFQHDKQSYNQVVSQQYNTNEDCLNSSSEVDCDMDDRSEVNPAVPFTPCENVQPLDFSRSEVNPAAPFSLCENVQPLDFSRSEVNPAVPFSLSENIQPLDFSQKETILLEQFPENSNLLEPDVDNSQVPYERYGNESSSNVQGDTVPVLSESFQDRTSQAVVFHLQTDEMSRSNEPGFHIAQVISEQIAEIEGSRVNEQFVSSVNEQCENKVSSSNDLESIVNDLSKIVEGSCEESSIVDDTNSIADSLENLLQK